MIAIAEASRTGEIVQPPVYRGLQWADDCVVFEHGRLPGHYLESVSADAPDCGAG